MKFKTFLTEKEATIIKMKFGFLQGEQFTFSEIANQLNLTAEGVRNIYNKALKKLRHPSRLSKLTSVI